MKNLIEAIRDQLRLDLAYVRAGDIFVTPHVDYVPGDVKFPCIGIKDGGISRSEGIDSCMEYTLEVILIPWVSIAKPEASVMGDASSNAKGVLDITDDIHESLDENLLAISGMIEAFSPAETGSEMLNTENRVLQKKQITYRYTKQSDRP